MPSEVSKKLDRPIEDVEKELADCREALSKVMRAVKLYLGYQNWPKIEGDFVDGVCKLLHDHSQKK